MPDQHAAATEHELLTAITEPLGQLPGDPLSVVSADFPVALRGYERFAVDAYVERMAEIVAELQATRSPETAVRRALERVGEEISGILQRAHDTADEITARSRSEAEERLETARREAHELTAAAERQVKDLDAETERIWAERDSIVTDTQELAARLMELAESAMERFPAAAPPPPDAETTETASPVAAAAEGIDIHVEPSEASVPAHLFDGAEALEAADPFLEEEEPTVEQSTAEHHMLEDPADDHLAVEHGPAADHSSTDQPTVDMPPIEPWEGEPAPFDPGQA